SRQSWIETSRLDFISQPFLDLAVDRPARHRSEIARHELLQPWVGIDVLRLLDPNNQMPAALEPEAQGLDLVDFKFERFFRIQIKPVQTLQGNRIIGEIIRLQASHERLKFFLAGGQFRKLRQPAESARN